MENAHQFFPSSVSNVPVVVEKEIRTQSLDGNCHGGFLLRGQEHLLDFVNVNDSRLHLMRDGEHHVCDFSHLGERKKEEEREKKV